jgi:Right handed beta helix region
MKTTKLFAGLAVALASWLAAGSAYALNDHSWVSSGASGTACTRITPCGDFFTAFNATNAGGVISVLTPGDYGNLNITKSIILRADAVDSGGTTGILAGGAMLLSAAISATDAVSIEGLRFVGGGISIDSGGLVFIRNCVIENNDGFDGFGIRVQSNGATRLVISDTTVVNNFNGTDGAGIWITPNSSGTAQVTLNHVLVEGNAFGIAADGSNSTRWYQLDDC